jgi:uncharacterized membrane protein
MIAYEKMLTWTFITGYATTLASWVIANLMDYVAYLIKGA